MSRIAVFGGTGYLASLIKSQNNIKKNRYIFFSRKKNDNNYINYSSLKKNSNIFKNFNLIIHLVGSNQNQLLKNKNLIKKKNKITSDICDLCITHNIKLIYISSMQIYKDYGKTNISKKSKINLKNPYSKSHHESEKIIKKKFLNHKNMFTILRIGNVFGFIKYKNFKEINNNLIHTFCLQALKTKKIIIKDGSIQRTFIPSRIFVQMINLIVKKNFFKNSVINIFYKNFNLKNISQIIKKRIKLIFNLNINIVVKKFCYQKKFLIHANPNFKLNPMNKKIFIEIDQILKSIKNNLN